MAQPNPPVAVQRLCGVTGHCAKLRGPMKVQITVGEEMERLPMYVTDIGDSCLLGLDYIIKRCRTWVDFGETTMRIRNIVVSLLELSSSAQVVAAIAVSILPKVGDRVVRRTLVQEDKDEFTVLMANLSDSEHHSQAGTTLRAR